MQDNGIEFWRSFEHGFFTLNSRNICCKGVRRYSSDETLEGHGTVGVGLIDAELHLTDGAKRSALVHTAMDEDVFLGPHNGNIVGVMDGLSDFPVFMDVDDVFSRFNAFSEESITMGVLLLHPSGC